MLSTAPEPRWKNNEWNKWSSRNAILDVCSPSWISSMTTAPACLRPVIFHGATSPKPPRRAEQILLSTNLQMPKCQVIFCSSEEKKNDASGYLKAREFLFFFLLSDVKAANGRFTPWVAFITWSFGAKLLSYIIVFMYYDTAFFVCVLIA